LKKSALFATYNQNDEVKKDVMGRACSMNGEKSDAHRILFAKSGGKRPLETQKFRWLDNIKMDLTETGWHGMDGLIWFRIGTIGELF
jgi:hypothetical protein